MLGYILLFLALVFYFKKKTRFLSIFLYVSFMFGTGGGGLCLLTDKVIGAKNIDLAIIYTFIINIYLLFTKQWVLPKTKWVTAYKVLLWFLVFGAMFSYFHYQFTPLQILQGERSYLLLFSLPILIRLSSIDLRKVITILLWVTVLTSVLYILQIVVGHPIMPYTLDYYTDKATGLVRIYNSPPLLSFFLIFSFVWPRIFKGPINVYRVLFFVTLICTLGRTYIFTTILSVMLAVMFNGKTTRMINTIFILGLLLLPFQEMIEQRFEGRDTKGDIEAIMQGSYIDFQGEGTMSYRFAWVYERYDYLKNRPLGEQVFGLGFISDSQPIVQKMYKFTIGGIDDDGNVAQLRTPDISYGNLLTRLGLVGSVIYLVFAISLAFLFFRHRKESPLMSTCAAHLLFLFIGSFSNSNLSEPRYLTIYFMVLSTIYFRKSFKYKIKNHIDESHTH